MDKRYEKLIPALKTVAPPRAMMSIARTVAFVRRMRSIHAAPFLWAVVLSRFSRHTPGFAEARHWFGRVGGARVWPRPFQKRFLSAAAVSLFSKAFELAVSAWQDPARRRPPHALARWFSDVFLWDSTQVRLHEELRSVFKGMRTIKAAAKVVLGVSAFGLIPLVAGIVPAVTNDKTLFPDLQTLRQGTLLLFDKGFESIKRFRLICEAGHFFVTRMRSNGAPTIVQIRAAPPAVRKALRSAPNGIPLRSVLPADKIIGRTWDLDVVFDEPKHGRVLLRLVIVPGPDGAQRPYLTNLRPDPWAPLLIREVYRLRWQIEMVFKELKQHLNLEAVPSRNRFAVQVFLWASLIALALSRTIAASLRSLPDLVGLAATLRVALVSRAIGSVVELVAQLFTAPKRWAAYAARLLVAAVEQQARPAPGTRRRHDSFERLGQALQAAA